MFQNILRSKTYYYSGIAAILFLVITLIACEKEVDINLDTGEPSLVVEGGIENGSPPFVMLTNSIGYFAQIDLNTLQNSFEHDAVVTVSNGTRTVTLREYTVDTGTNGNKFSFYSIDTSGGQFFIGELGKFYTLKITTKNGKTYESLTKIPYPTVLDSVISVVPAPPYDADGNPDARQMKIFFKDPDTTGNFVRYFTQRPGEPFYAGLNSVYPDDVINGTRFETEVPFGEPRTATFNRDSFAVAFVGDTVTLRWSAIDKNVYDFWSNYEYALGTLGNPFSTPIQVQSNINNGALGVWAGYGSTYTTIVLK